MAFVLRQHSRRYGWFAVCVGIAVLVAFNGVYYSYSDRYIAIWTAVVLLTLGWMAPRATVVGFLALVVVLSISGLLLGTLRDRSPDDLSLIRPGMERAAVAALAGTPQLVLATRDDLLTVDIGYSVPSPYRYRHDGPIDVYFGAFDSAYWVFYRDGRVVDVFVGGS